MGNDIVYICDEWGSQLRYAISNDLADARKRSSKIANEVYGENAVKAIGDSIDFYHGIVLPARLVPNDLHGTSVFIVKKKPLQSLRNAKLYTMHNFAKSACREIKIGFVDSESVSIDHLWMVFCRDLGPLFKGAEDAKTDFEIFDRLRSDMARIEKLATEEKCTTNLRT